MLKTEEIYMEQNNKRMHEVTEPLYFVIEEKLNSVDLTDKGIDLITGNSEDPTLFVLPDIAAQLSELENQNLTNEQLLEKKDELLRSSALSATIQTGTGTVQQQLPVTRSFLAVRSARPLTMAVWK